MNMSLPSKFEFEKGDLPDHVPTTGTRDFYSPAESLETIQKGLTSRSGRGILIAW